MDDVIKQAVLYAAASFERRYPYYQHGIVTDLDEIADMLRQALAYYHIDWTFGQREKETKQRRFGRKRKDIEE